MLEKLAILSLTILFAWAYFFILALVDRIKKHTK